MKEASRKSIMTAKANFDQQYRCQEIQGVTLVNVKCQLRTKYSILRKVGTPY